MLLIAIIICGFTFVGISFGAAQPPTPVNGIITQNTTWTKTNSPHNLQGNILVEKGVVLTIESNVIVNFNGFYIRVNGTLIIRPGATINLGVTGTNPGLIQVNGVLSARGTSTQPIFFNGAIYWWGASVPPSKSSISFSTYTLPWNQQTGDGCIIEKAVLKNVGVGISNHVKFDNNTISGAGISVTGGSPLVAHSVLSSGDSISISGGSPIISNNRLDGGYILIKGAVDRPIITNNLISNPDPKWPFASSASISVVGGDLGDSPGEILIKKQYTPKQCIWNPTGR